MTTGNRPNIIVEANIPFIRGVMESWAAVRYLPPEEITPRVMRDADALVTRTRVKCNAELLDGSRCSLIASATIGLDHVDTAYCENRCITVRNAPGCNAPAVAQYVHASILRMMRPEEVTLGIVGVGNVGRIVERWAKSLGMTVLLCDPPRARREGPSGFTDMDTIAREANVITFHTPYTRIGEDATHHLCGREWLAKVGRRPVIINAARGAVSDTDALIEAIEAGKISSPVIDCWEGEPNISKQLLDLAAVATPHIAGYSYEGKARATRMAVMEVCRHFGAEMPAMEPNVPMGAKERVTAEEIMRSYNPYDDTLMLRERPAEFERLRTQYVLRREP